MPVLSPERAGAIIGGALALSLIADQAQAASLTRLDVVFTGVYQTLSRAIGDSYYGYNPQGKAILSLVYDPAGADLQGKGQWIDYQRPEWVKSLTVAFPDRQGANLPWGDRPFTLDPARESWWVGDGLIGFSSTFSTSIGYLWNIPDNRMIFSNTFGISLVNGTGRLQMGGWAFGPSLTYTGGPMAMPVEGFHTPYHYTPVTSLKLTPVEEAAPVAAPVEVTEAVPEPATIVGSLAGLGLLGGWVKRRRGLAAARRNRQMKTKGKLAD